MRFKEKIIYMYRVKTYRRKPIKKSSFGILKGITKVEEIIEKDILRIKGK